MAAVTVGMLAFAAALSAVRPTGDGDAVTSRVVIEYGCVAAAAVSAAAWGLLKWAGRRTVRIVGDGRTVTIAGSELRLAVPVGDVRAVRVATDVRDGRSAAVEVVTDAGGLQALGGWDLATVAWAADAVAAAAGVPVGGDSTGGPTIRAGDWYGTARWIGPGSLVACAVIATFAASPVRVAFASPGWPTAVGRVTRSAYAVDRHGKQDVVTAELAYRYAVDGRTYDGDRIAAMRDDDDGPVERAVETHPTGSAVDVRYDPADPGRAVVVPGAGWQPYAVLVVLMLTAAAGGWLTMRVRPTAAQTALARRYRRAAAARDEGEVLVRWTDAAELVEAHRRARRRRAALIGVRGTALVVAATAAFLWACSSYFGPDIPIGRVALAVGFFGVVPFAAEWAGTFGRVRPVERRVTTAGVVAPREKLPPLSPWSQVAGYDVEPHPLVADARVLVIRVSRGAARRLPLPTDPVAAAAVIEAVRDRVPHRPPAATDAPIRPVDGWITFGLVVAVTWAGGRIVADHATAIHLHDTVGWVMLLAAVGGPGTWIAVVLRRRRAWAGLMTLVVLANTAAMLGMMTVAAVRITAAHVNATR